MFIQATRIHLLAEFVAVVKNHVNKRCKSYLSILDADVIRNSFVKFVSLINQFILKCRN